MSREIQTSIHCDGPDCRKQPGKGENNHIVITVYDQDARERNGDVFNGQARDYCSWDHALADLGHVAKDAAKVMKQLAKEQADAEAAKEQAAAEAASSE